MTKARNQGGLFPFSASAEFRPCLHHPAPLLKQGVAVIAAGYVATDLVSEGAVAQLQRVAFLGGPVSTEACPEAVHRVAVATGRLELVIQRGMAELAEDAPGLARA